MNVSNATKHMFQVPTFLNDDDTGSVIPDLFAIRQRAQSQIDGGLSSCNHGILALYELL